MRTVARPVVNTFVAALALLASSPLVHAQTARSSGGSSTQQAIRQVQQLASERTALQAENEQLKAQLADLRQKLAAAESQAKALRGRTPAADAALAQARAASADLEAEVVRRKEREGQLVAEFRKTVETLRTVEGDRTSLQQRTAALGREHEACLRNNAELTSIALDVLSRYENSGFGHALGRSEPFTRLARTRLENYVDENRGRVEELRSAPNAAAGEAPSSPGRP